MKTKQKHRKRRNRYKLPLLQHSIRMFMFLLIVSFASCTDNEACSYDEPVDPVIPVSCDLESELNLSTGIDVSGNLLPTPTGATTSIDPYWKLLNNPSLSNCPYILDGNLYSVNFSSSGPNAWVNQTGATSLSPINSGNLHVSSSQCVNPNNTEGEPIPYVLERSFCVLEDTSVDLNFTFKADNALYFELIDNSTLSIIDTSMQYIWAITTGLGTWNTAGINLSAGSYSIRGYMVNYGGPLGFSLLGTMNTSNGDLALSNNNDGCCENNVISVLNILEDNCNGVFDDGIDQFGPGWIFNLKDSSNTLIQTQSTDSNGTIFFTGLPDGNYTVEIVNQAGWVQFLPNTTGIYPVSVSNNQVEIVEFFNCIN